MNSLLSLRASVAEILALSVLESFPGTVLGDLHLSDTQFRYLFHFNHPKHPELLPLLEEKMRGVIKSNPLIEEVEMAASSAVHYFEHLSQPFKAEAAELAEAPTLPMVRIGTFYDFMQVKPYTQDISGAAFQLLEAKEVEEGIEIVGTAFFNKEELKAFVKRRKAWFKAKPWEAQERFGLSCLVDGEIALLPKGVELCHALEKFWRKSIQDKGAIQEIITKNRSLYPLLAERLRVGLAEWAADNDHPDGQTDLCYFLTLEHQLQQRCISSLQFIQQTFNMLELSADWVLCEKTDAKKEIRHLKEALKICGFPYTVDSHENSLYAAKPMLSLRIHDSLGERWPGPFLSVSLMGSSLASIEYSLLGPIKRLIALMAERKMAEDMLKDREIEVPFKWPEFLKAALRNEGEK
jgi:threonyl-tRNA synthetase